MDMIIYKISKIGIVPVVVLQDAKDALALGKALVEGGLPCAEVTFRTEAAEESIRIMTKNYPEMLVGAGTVLTTDQVDCAIGAGAKFIVSSGFNPNVVQYCISKQIPIVPGVMTPSELEQTLALGLDAVKFFPSEVAGGLQMIKAMTETYRQANFMPTGGITPENVTSFLQCKKVFACGGSWMVKESLIVEGKFDVITKLVKEAAEIVQSVRGQ